MEHDAPASDPPAAAGVSPAVPATDRDLPVWSLFQVVLALFVGLSLATPLRDTSFYALGIVVGMLLIERKYGAPAASGSALAGMTAGAVLGLALFVRSLHSLQAGVLGLADRTPYVVAQASIGLCGMALAHRAHRSGSTWAGLGLLGGAVAAVVLDLLADPFL